jgi:hypothetical protein
MEAQKQEDEKACKEKEKCLGQMRHRKMLLVKVVVALVCLPFLLLLVVVV